MPFFVIDRENKVRTDGHMTELEAKRDALRIIGRLSYDSVQRLDPDNIDRMFRSIETAGHRTIYSTTHQRMGEPYKRAPAG
jgi:hypothetical protein